MADTNQATEPTTAELFEAAAKDEGITAEPVETEESEAVTADEDTTEEETETTEESEDAEVIENDDDDVAVPSLNEKIVEALGDNAEALDLWSNHWKGVEKRERKLAEREEILTKDEKGWQVYSTYAEAFASDDPKVVKDAYEFLGKQLFPEAKAEPEPVASEDGTITYDGQTFYSEREVDLYKRIQSLESQKDPEIEAIKADHRKRQESDARKEWLDSNSQSIIARVQKTTGGWGVTKDQISKVLETNRDGLTRDPVATLKSAYPDAYADWKAARAKKTDIPDMIQGGDAKGMKLPENKADWSFEHHLAAIASEG